MLRFISKSEGAEASKGAFLLLFLFQRRDLIALAKRKRSCEKIVRVKGVMGKGVAACVAVKEKQRDEE